VPTKFVFLETLLQLSLGLRALPLLRPMAEASLTPSAHAFPHFPFESYEEVLSWLASSRIWTCLQCLSNCRCRVFIAAAGFLANPGPAIVKYASQLAHLPCSPDLSFWVTSRCGFFMPPAQQQSEFGFLSARRLCGWHSECRKSPDELK